MWLLSNEHCRRSIYSNIIIRMQQTRTERNINDTIQKQMEHAIRISCDSLNYNFLNIFFFLSFGFTMRITHATLKLMICIYIHKCRYMFTNLIS